MASERDKVLLQQRVGHVAIVDRVVAVLQNVPQPGVLAVVGAAPALVPLEGAPDVLADERERLLVEDRVGQRADVSVGVEGDAGALELGGRGQGLAGVDALALQRGGEGGHDGGLHGVWPEWGGEPRVEVEGSGSDERRMGW